MAVLGLTTGCKYNELPPKTDDATTTYTLPAGEIPSAEEKAVQTQARNEYNQYLEQNK